MDAPHLEAQRSPTGRTSWPRFALAATLSASAACAMVFATATAALPASLALSGPAFRVSADRLEGTGFVQFAQIGQTAVDGTAAPVAVSGIGSARMTNLCQSTLIATPLGELTLRVTAGSAAPVTASNLVINLTEFSGDVTFTGLQLGVDASTVDRVPGVRGTKGSYAQQSDEVVIDGFRATARLTTAGTFRLTGMRMELRTGRQECF
jgi:hypothetical protein